MNMTISCDEFYHQRNTPLRTFPIDLLNSLSNTKLVLFKPQVTKVISFFLQTWQVRYPMGRGQQGESIKTTFISLSLFPSPRWAFFWSSANMTERHFWHIDIFFLKYILVRRMIWLDAPQNTLEIRTLRIFLSSSYELWWEFP